MTKNLVLTALFALLSAPAATADHHKSGHHSKSDKKAARELHEPISKKASKKAAKNAKAQEPRRTDAVSGSRNERAAQMQARNADRKTAKETYEAEVAAGGERVKGKKTWWKVWSD